MLLSGSENPSRETSDPTAACPQIRYSHLLDTSRASTADKAMEASADLINDVSIGERDPAMYGVMAKWIVPVCLMYMSCHSTIMTKTDYGADSNLMSKICKELNRSVQKAIAAGIHHWNIIVDSSIGFAKDSN
jgi:dihydropteroate synthase